MAIDGLVDGTHSGNGGVRSERSDAALGRGITITQCMAYISARMRMDTVAFDAPLRAQNILRATIYRNPRSLRAEGRRWRSARWRRHQWTYSDPRCSDLGDRREVSRQSACATIVAAERS